MTGSPRSTILIPNHATCIKIYTYNYNNLSESSFFISNIIPNCFNYHFCLLLFEINAHLFDQY